MKFRKFSSLLIVLFTLVLQIPNNKISEKTSIDINESIKIAPNSIVKSLKNKTSLYIWGLDDMDYTHLAKTIDYLNIDTLHVELNTSDFETYENRLFFSFAKQNNLKVYIIYGSHDNRPKDNLNGVKKIIDQVDSYNKNSDYKITGITIDYEFYLIDEYPDSSDKEGRLAIFREYNDFMKEAHNYANNKNLKYIACIPVWLESLSKEYLDDLIENASDGIQLMNYSKVNMIKGIEYEIGKAENFKKPVENIAELQPAGKHELTDNETFYSDGIIKCLEKFKEIEQKYPYSDLKFSFHYYKYVKELVGREIDLTDSYNYELYTYDKSSTPIQIQKAYLVSGSERIEGLDTYSPKSKEYIKQFPNVKFNKEYQLVIEDSKYELTKEKKINEEKTTERIIYGSVSFDKKQYFKITLESNKKDLKPNETFTITVSINEIAKNDNNAIKTIIGKLIYDNNILEIDPNSLTMLNSWRAQDDLSLPENLSFITDVTDYKSELGNMFNISFKVKDNINTNNTIIQINSLNGLDSSNKNINGSAEAIELNIIKDSTSESIPTTPPKTGKFYSFLLIIICFILASFGLLISIKNNKFNRI